MSKPIKPSEVVGARVIPDIVIDVWNELIAEKFDAGSALIYQNDVVNRILARMPDARRADVFDSGWLNIETLYRAHGWKVHYDKPGYNETYEPTFTFEEA